PFFHTSRPPRPDRHGGGATGIGTTFTMVNRNLLRQFDVGEPDLPELEEVGNAFHDYIMQPEEQQFEVNKIVTGRVLNLVGDLVLVDVGYKSEGVIPVPDWYAHPLDRLAP